MVGVLTYWWEDGCVSTLGSLFLLWNVKWGHHVRAGGGAGGGGIQVRGEGLTSLLSLGREQLKGMCRRVHLVLH